MHRTAARMPRRSALNRWEGNSFKLRQSSIVRMENAAAATRGTCPLPRALIRSTRLATP
jgi:hypothetical protein